MPVRLILFLLLLLLVGICGYVLECDGALDFLAGEDSLVVPMDKYADVAGFLGWGHVKGGWSLSEGRQLGRDAGQTNAASPFVLSRCPGDECQLHFVVMMEERRSW